MLRLVNQERTLAGIQPLVADDRLREVARAHSEEMFRLGYFAHDSPLSGSPFDRLRTGRASSTLRQARTSPTRRRSTRRTVG